MTLRYISKAELDRIRTLDGDRQERAAAFADACRLNVLYMVERVGSGHLGTTFARATGTSPPRGMTLRACTRC